MLSPESSEIERHLAQLLGAEPGHVRDYLYEVVEERLWRGRNLTQRRTGFRFVRGTHGGAYVRDPDGTDIVPPGVETPPETVSRRRAS